MELHSAELHSNSNLMNFQMRKVKQIEIKNRTYNFYNNINNIEEFNSKIDKKSYKDINIYYVEYITIKKIDDCENIYSEMLCI